MNNLLYLRFVIPVVDGDSRTEAGFFRWAYDVQRAARHVDRWIRDELRRELDWFDDRLEVPDQLCRTFKRRRTIHGICWFRPEARDHIGHARYVGWLMTEAGAPVREIKCAHPGEVIWRDDVQIVAKPAPKMPRAFTLN